MTDDRIQAAFEAGIKLGALYHQWVGTPISPRTTESVATAIAQAVALQPFVEEIEVVIDTGRMTPNAFGYSELAGIMFEVTIETQVGTARCRASLKEEDGYPMMKIIECDETD
jgi:hypothetical protein